MQSERVVSTFKHRGLQMHKLMDMANVLPGDGYVLRKGKNGNGGEVSVNLKGIKRVGGVDGMTRRLVAIWEEMPEHYKRVGWHWYDEGNDFARALAETFNHSVWQTAQVISVLSPQNPWAGAFDNEGRQFKDGNRLCALNVLQAWHDGGESAIRKLKGWGYAPKFIAKAIKVLKGEELDWSTAPKTHRFALLLDNPKLTDIVVIDSHASRIATGNLGGKYHVVEKSAYLPMERAYLNAAIILGIPAYVLQAGTWQFAVDGGLY